MNLKVAFNFFFKFYKNNQNAINNSVPVKYYTHTASQKLSVGFIEIVIFAFQSNELLESEFIIFFVFFIANLLASLHLSSAGIVSPCFGFKF